MRKDESALATYEARLSELWERMVRVVGVHTVNVLMERAIWEAARKHPELELIERDDTGFSFDALNKSLAGRPESEIAEAFDDLTSELLLIMARLVGREMAHALAEELNVKVPREKQPARGGKAKP